MGNGHDENSETITIGKSSSVFQLAKNLASLNKEKVQYL